MARMLLYSVIDRRQSGGAQVVVARLLDALRRQGHGVMDAWAAPAADNPGASPPPAGGDWICPLHIRPGPDGAGVARRPWHLPSLLRLTVGLARRRPEIVNVHFISEQALYFLLLRPLFGYRLVLSAHGSDVMDPDPAWAAHLPGLLRGADAVTVVSRTLRDRVLAVPGVAAGRVHLIPNGVDTGFWTPAGPADGGEAGPDPTPDAPGYPTIVAVGRLEPVKGFDVLVGAMALLHRTHPRARLCLIGDGSQAAVLRRQVEAAGLAGIVSFTGALPPLAVRDRLRGAAIHALPSRSEGLPLALLEAMACGLPPVATRVGGVAEVLRPGTGVLVPAEDAGALARALATLLDDPVLRARLAAAARRRALDFSAAAAEAAYARLYRSLLPPGF